MNTSSNIKILKSDVESNIASKQNLRNIAIILLAIIFIMIITLAEKDNKSFYINTALYTVVILTFIFSIFSFIIISFDTNVRSAIFLYLTIVIVIILAIVLTRKSGIITLVTNDYFKNSILLCIILFALIIVYYLFLEKYANQPGWPSFIIKFLFYIPCVITDGIKYLVEDFYSTKSYVFYLIIVEFILIAIYFYFYPRLQQSVYDNGVILLKDPTPLNEVKRIDLELYKSFANRKPLPGSKLEIRSPNRNTYSLSMWIFLNNQPLSQYSYTKETTIFSYVDSEGNPHPKITYKNDKNGLDQYIIYLSSKDKYGISLPHQKWNNIVFNYRDLNVDIFINSVFETSIKLSELPKYTNRDIVSVGENGLDDRTGLFGSICNVVYYKNIMTQGQIIDNYNLLSIRNPPVN
jgi:hypothetical protein